MKKKASFIAIALALVLACSALTGCGSSNLDPGNYANVVAAVVGDDTIYMDQANFFLRYNQWSLESYYWNYYQYMGMANMWEAPSSDNPDQTMATGMKEQVMNELLDTRIVLAHAGEYNVSLTEEDLAKVRDTVELIKDFGPDFLKYANVTDEQMTEWLSQNALAVKTIKTIKDAAEVSVSDADCEMFTVSYLQIPDANYSAQTSEDGTQFDTAQGEAEYIVKHVQDGTKSFADMAAEFHAETTEKSFPISDEAPTDNAARIGRTLKTGEIVMEHVENAEDDAENGWYVVYCESDHDEEATAKERENKEAELRDDYFEEIYAGWTEGIKVDVKSAYDDLLVSDGNPIFTTPTEAETEAPAEESSSEG